MFVYRITLNSPKLLGEVVANSAIEAGKLLMGVPVSRVHRTTLYQVYDLGFTVMIVATRNLFPWERKQFKKPCVLYWAGDFEERCAEAPARQKKSREEFEAVFAQKEKERQERLTSGYYKADAERRWGKVKDGG